VLNFDVFCSSNSQEGINSFTSIFYRFVEVYRDMTQKKTIEEITVKNGEELSLLSGGELDKLATEDSQTVGCN
jgi:hypothetical protein